MTDQMLVPRRIGVRRSTGASDRVGAASPRRSVASFWTSGLAVLCLLALPITVASAADTTVIDESRPAEKVRVTYRIRGLFCPEREEELRGLWAAELPAIKLLAVDSLRGEAMFEFDPVAALGPPAKAADAERMRSLFNEKVHAASLRKYPGYWPWLSVFTAVPSSPAESLQHVEIPLEGIDCQACSLALHDRLVQLDGIEHAQVSFHDGRAILLVDPSKFDEIGVRRKLQEQHIDAMTYCLSGGVRREGKINGAWKRRPAVPVATAAAPESKSGAVPPKPSAPADTVRFVDIPGGEYERGNASGDIDFNWSPVQKLTLSGYRIAATATTKAQWDGVRSWAVSHGYTDLPEGEGRAGGHPVHSVTWYDVVKWCNAASEKEGLTPCYRNAEGIYRTGTAPGVGCDWQADGYRLPTEAEWEVAARGGLVGKRFPWGDTISHDQANYRAGGTDELPFDTNGGVRGYHPKFVTEGEACTSPVGSFAANGYGLFDMAGNVSQWCWDWFARYEEGIEFRGPGTGAFRIVRGGNWAGDALSAACAIRFVALPSLASTNVGFRVARSQPSRPNASAGQ